MGSAVVVTRNVPQISNVDLRIVLANGQLVIWDVGRIKVLFSTPFVLDWYPSFNVGVYAEQGGPSYDAFLKPVVHVPVIEGLPDLRNGGLPFVTSWANGNIRADAVTGFPGLFPTVVTGTGTKGSTSKVGGILDARDFLMDKV